MRWGLRGKALAIFTLASLLAILVMALIGWRLHLVGKNHSAQVYAQNYTELSLQKIYAPISKEIALANLFADSPILKAWMKAPEDKSLSDLFFSEFEHYRHAFKDRAIFLAVDQNRAYYFYDDNAASQQLDVFTPKYYLAEKEVNDSWYFATLADDKSTNINVDIFGRLNLAKIWLNVQVKDEGKVIGLAGTGFDFGEFLERHILTKEPGVSAFIFNQDGALQAHPNESLIAFNSVGLASSLKHNILGQLSLESDKQQLQKLLQTQVTGEVKTLSLTLAGIPQVMSVAYLPELGWFIATAVDVSKSQVLNWQLIWPSVLAMIGLFLAILFVVGLMIERFVIAPVGRLQNAAKSISKGQYDVPLTDKRNNEIGDLSLAFETMIAQVRKRTLELEQSNLDMLQTQRKLGASIDYASLIQRAILPDRQMADALGDQISVVWRPRDVVGGDFYFFQESDDGCLIGLFDCAGHGVPGALMTMLLRAALDQAIKHDPIHDPAVLLQRVDATLREMMGSQQSINLATNADAALVYADYRHQRVLFSGAKISLQYYDGDGVKELKGAKRALGDKRMGHFYNQDISLYGHSFYLVSDGLLDQSGGDKAFGFGNKRFTQLLLKHQALPLAEQVNEVMDVVDKYRGELPQRDDISLLAFCFDSSSD